MSVRYEEKNLPEKHEEKNMTVKYEEKKLYKITDSMKLKAYEYSYKNLRDGPNIISAESLGELLKIFFPGASIVFTFETIDSGCFSYGKKLIKKIKIIEGENIKTFEYNCLDVKKFITEQLNVSCSEVL